MNSGGIFNSAVQNVMQDTQGSVASNPQVNSQNVQEPPKENVQNYATTVTNNNDTWECPNCKKQVAGKFCSECGAKKPEVKLEKFCTECGAKLSPTAKFCTECGNKVN